MSGLVSQGSLLILGGNEAERTSLAGSLSELGLVVVRQLPADDSLIGVIYLTGWSSVNLADALVDEQIRLVTDMQTVAHPLIKNSGWLLLVEKSHRDGAGLGSVALARTARIEWPEMVLRHLEISEELDVAQLVVQELLWGADQAEVVYNRDGERLTWLDHALPAQPDDLPLVTKDLVVVSGGGQGVTAACVLALARQLPLRFLLLGRTPLLDEPAAAATARTEGELVQCLSTGGERDLQTLRRQAGQILSARQIRANIHRLEQLGSEVRYVAVDIHDASALAQVMEEARAHWGPVQALIHGAGVLADKRLLDKQPAQLRQVLSTKLSGLQALLQAVGEDPLKLLVLFSSVAARYGNRGQVDYAMANEVLNRQAALEARRRKGCRVKSLLWGPWDGGMVTPALRTHFQQSGIPLIAIDQGSAWFVQELSTPVSSSGETMVVLGEGRQLSATDTVNQGLFNYPIAVSARLLPQLRDHQVAGRVVVPVAQVVTWFVQALRQAGVDTDDYALHDCRLLAGITLEPFDDSVTWLRVQLESEGAAWSASLWDGHDRCRYRGQFRALNARPIFAQSPPDKAQLSIWPKGLESIYGESGLFHGPAFQMIERLQSFSDHYASVYLRTNIEHSWRDNPWPDRTALVDGCLQLVVLWGIGKGLGTCLPTAVERLTWYPHGDTPAHLLGQVWVREKATGIAADVQLVDEHGKVWLSLQGIECYPITDVRRAKAMEES